MKRFVLLHFMFFISLFLFGQGSNSNNSLPKVEKGATCRVILDTKGKKYIDICINEVTYYDSTETSCKVKYSATMTSIGTKTVFGSYQDFFGWHDGHHFNCRDVHYTPPISEIPKNGSVTFESHNWLPDEKCVAINFDHKDIMVFPIYDGSVYKQKRKEIAARNKAREDSLFNVFYQKDTEQVRLTTRSQQSHIPEIPVYDKSLPDTILVWTDKSITSSTIWKYYIIREKRGEMVICITDEKRDTTFYNEMSSETRQRYPREIRTLEIRALPIEKVDADMAFYYFSIGDSIDFVLNRLGSKKVHVYESGFKVPFYNKFIKKDEIICLEFMEGKLVKISRPSPKHTLPTNDVWEAFQLLKMQDDMKKIKPNKKNKIIR